MIALRTAALALATLSLWRPLGAQELSAYRVPSMSMQPTLRIGDVLVYRTFRRATETVTPIVKRGDFLIFRGVTADDSQLVITKRVLGLPGDTLRMDAGRLKRNGTWVEEPYASYTAPADTDDAMFVARMRAWQLDRFVGTPPRSYAPTRNHWGPIVVPLASVFVLGDNRDRSFDSRHFGAVPVANLIGLVEEVRDSTQSKVRWRRPPLPN